MDFQDQRIKDLENDIEQSRIDAAFALRNLRGLSDDLRTKDTVIRGLASEADRQFENMDRERKMLERNIDEHNRTIDRLNDELNRMERDFRQQREDNGWTINLHHIVTFDGTRRIISPQNLVPFAITGQWGNEKIPTIKAVRILCGLGLKEAKDLVDSWTDLFPKPQPPVIDPVKADADYRGDNPFLQEG